MAVMTDMADMADTMGIMATAITGTIGITAMTGVTVTGMAGTAGIAGMAGMAGSDSGFSRVRIILSDTIRPIAIRFLWRLFTPTMRLTTTLIMMRHTYPLPSTRNLLIIRNPCT